MMMLLRAAPNRIFNELFLSNHHDLICSIQKPHDLIHSILTTIMISFAQSKLKSEIVFLILCQNLAKSCDPFPPPHNGFKYFQKRLIGQVGISSRERVVLLHSNPQYPIQLLALAFFLEALSKTLCMPKFWPLRYFWIFWEQSARFCVCQILMSRVILAASEMVVCSIYCHSKYALRLHSGWLSWN